MADTLTNIPIPLETWVEIYDAASINPGSRIDIQNIGVTDLFFAIASTQPAVDSDQYRIFERDEIINLSDGDLAVWVFSPQADGLVNAAEFSFTASSQFPNDYYLEVRKGNIPGSRIIDIDGANPSAGISQSNLWGPGGIIVYSAPGGDQLEFIFTDPNDTATGLGAQEVTFTYLDDAHVKQSEVLASNGGTVLTVATNILRFIEAKVTAKGSGDKNAGDINIQVAGGGFDRGVIFAEKNKTLNGFYTTPAGKTSNIIYGFTGVQKGKDAEMAILVTDGDDGIFVERFPLVLYQNTFAFDPKAPTGNLIEKTDLQVVVTSTNSGTKAALFLQILEVDNE